MMNKEDVQKINDMALGKTEGGDELIQSFRDKFGLKQCPMGGMFGEFENVRCDEAQYFPAPPSFWTEISPLMYRLLADNCGEFIKGWTYKGLRVLASAVKYHGWEWLHVSFSRPNRIPSYEEVQLVKENFFGDRKAIMVFPTKEHYVNTHKYCLHLWYSIDNPIPDFDIEIKGLGRQI